MQFISIKRLALRTGYAIFILGLVYILLLVVMFLFSEFPPVEPFLSTFNFLVLICAILLMIFWTSIYTGISSEYKFFGLLSLLFIVVFTTLTSINRFVALTVVRQSISNSVTEGLNWFLPYSWPSIMLAIEILGWGLFFGLACLALTPAFYRHKTTKFLFFSLLITGMLSIFAAIGQIANSLILSLFGPLAWGPFFTLTIFLLVRWLKNESDL